jgi:hypothetical protein
MKAIFASCACLILAAAPALAAPAKPAEEQKAAALQTLLNCRKLTDKEARLACFDESSGVLDTAAAKGDVVVVDRAQVQAMKRQAFGFTLPSLSQYLDRGEHKDEVDERIELTLSGVSHGGDGHVVYTFDDGSSWRQVDDSDPGLQRRVGQKTVIRRAMMGSFFMEVAKQPGVRVVRMR